MTNPPVCSDRGLVPPARQINRPRGRSPSPALTQTRVPQPVLAGRRWWEAWGKIPPAPGQQLPGEVANCLQGQRVSSSKGRRETKAVPARQHPKSDRVPLARLTPTCLHRVGADPAPLPPGLLALRPCSLLPAPCTNLALSRPASVQTPRGRPGRGDESHGSGQG